MASEPYDGMTPGAAPPPPSPPSPPPPLLPAGRPVAAPTTLREHWGRLSGGAAAALAALWKLKVLAILLKLKFVTFFATIFVSYGAYAWLYGWKFAVGLVGLLAVHEFGHLVVLRARGVKTSLPVFVPLLGAFVMGAPTTVYTSALGSIAGPGFGALGALASLWVWDQGGSEVWHAVAAFGFFMNLFNLLPVPFLDGGHIWTALRGKQLDGPGSARVYGLTPTQRTVIGAAYVALVIVLAVASKNTYFHRTFS